MSETPNYASFAENLNTMFTVTVGEDDPDIPEMKALKIELELIEAIEKKREMTEGFSLLFQGGDKLVLNQKIHNFSHAKLGDFQLFIVPVGKNDRGLRYEAIINRLIEKKGN